MSSPDTIIMSSTGANMVTSPQKADKTGTYVIITLYLCSMVLVGIYYFWANRKKKNAAATDSKNKVDSIEEHFLGGRNFGTVFLTFTMFATVFSGYTVVGIPAEAFGTGFRSLRWIGAIFVIVGMFVVLYPRLRKLSIHYNFSSPTSLIARRFDDPKLTNLCIFCQVVPTVLYLIAQFASLSSTVVSLTGSKDAGLQGAIFLGLLIFIIESLGGLNSVAATDVIQSCLLIFGFITIPFLLLGEYGTIETNMNNLLASGSSFLDSPKPEQNVATCSWLLALASFPLYPHLVQRIYAAKDNTALKRMWGAMAVAPWLTVIPGVMLGIYAKVHLPSSTVSNQVFGSMLTELLNFGAFSYLVASAVLTASLAAIMSTADSALIAISNIITLDVYKKSLKPAASENEQLFFSKIVSFLCVVLSVICSTQKMNLGTLLEVQGGILLQILPAFLCGLYTDSVGAIALFWGGAVGVLETIILAILIKEKVILKSSIYFISAGMFGTLSNIILVIIISFATKHMPKGGDSRITFTEIRVRMKNVVEPVSHPIGKFLTPLGIVFCIFVNPFFFKYAKTTKLSSGLPGWAIWMVVITVFWFLETFIATQLWDDPTEFDTEGMSKDREDIELTLPDKEEESEKKSDA